MLLNHLKRPVKEEKPEWNQLISDQHRWFNVVETEDREEITEAIVISKRRKLLATIWHRTFLRFREAYPEIS